VAVLNDLLDTGFIGVPSGRPLDEEYQNLIDISRAGVELRFAPTIDLRNGLTRCVQAFSGGLFTGPKQDMPRFTEA
jgi:hypothetical protein